MTDHYPACVSDLKRIPTPETETAVIDTSTISFELIVKPGGSIQVEASDNWGIVLTPEESARLGSALLNAAFLDPEDDE